MKKEKLAERSGQSDGTDGTEWEVGFNWQSDVMDGTDNRI